MNSAIPLNKDHKGLRTISLMTGGLLIGVVMAIVALSSAGRSSAAGLGAVRAAQPALGTPHWEAPNCGGATWQVETVPNGGTASNLLSGISAMSPSDIWAVGQFFSPNFNSYHALVVRWNGTEWNQVAAPAPNAYHWAQLYAVAPVSANDVWAVGAYNSVGSGGSQAQIVHWDGSSWTWITTPHPTASSGALKAIKVVSTNDVWAVGFYLPSQTSSARTLVLHWDGATWRVVTSPNSTTYDDNMLYGIDGVAANDLWAVGNTGIFHWNGVSWSRLTNLPAGTGTLTGVSALAANNVWAVGSNASIRTQTLHWDGSSWSIMPSPNPTHRDSYLTAVDGAAADDVWAVGYYLEGSNTRLLTMHWNGSGWTIVPSPDQSQTYNSFQGVAATQPGEAIAVGHIEANGIWETLAERYNDPPCVTPTTTPVSTPQPPCPVTWKLVPAANPSSRTNKLYGVATISSSDMWAVGEYYDDLLGFTSPLIEHWSGTGWNTFDSGFTGNGTLRSVAAISANDVWAVGERGLEALIVHWNGASWSVVSVPHSGMGANYLYGVSALAANDVWAVGYNVSTHSALTMHWNGGAWSIVPEAQIGSGSNQNSLQAVAAVSPNDVWAVGYYVGSSASPLIEHWNGTIWSLVEGPSFGKLYAISALSASDIWVVGRIEDGPGTDQDRTLTAHWNGGGWSFVPNPSSTPYGHLNGVTALAPNDVWAVGESLGYPYPALVEHWDGGVWSVVPVPNPVGGAALYAVDALSDQDVTAVGSTTQNSGSQAVVERYVGTSPLTDIHPQDYFYEPVRYLYCAGVVTGYEDNTFRPYNTTTRAQLTKIVVLAQQWGVLNPDSPTFTDVAHGSTFYGYIETAVSHNLIRGYPCGNPEPCDPQSRPYFRPGAAVTRAQLTKIVVLARGWSLLEPPSARFSDVPVGSTFYSFVETAVAHGILSGYACGNPEPCDPQSRPYFRPGSSATRGQIAKIVYNAISGP